MASGQTEHYGLNQWEANDQVRREEFNADNAKLDAALEELKKALPVVKLREWTIPEAANQVQLELDGIAPGDYTGLRLFIQGFDWTGSTGIRLNGVATGYRHRWMSDLNDEAKTLLPFAYWKSSAGYLELYPLLDGTMAFSRGIQVLSASTITKSDGHGWLPSLPYTQIETLQLVWEEAEDTFGAGTRLTLYGLRY